MLQASRTSADKLEILTLRDFDRIPQLLRLPRATRLEMRAVAHVLPFRVNRYVIDELIDWQRVPQDPLFQLTFPQPGMLDSADLRRMCDLLSSSAPTAQVAAAARAIQVRMNPHPAGQMELNVPRLDQQALPGMQHKYRETLLFFPSKGQTCHSYCTYCFRWPQFVGLDDLRFASNQASLLVDYLRAHKEINSVLFTGGDPMVMSSRVLRRYVEPLLAPDLDHINSIRIGTKAPAYWPQRFYSDADADDLMRLFEQVRRAGRHLALMAHYSHPRELEPPPAQYALHRIQAAGAVVRCQAPLIRHVNDAPQVWAQMWQRQVLLGAVPYYMFIERDTGPSNYFSVALARAHAIFSEAYRRVSGLARTVRGPSMSATPGKVMIEGVCELERERVFVLKMLQGRDPAWANRVFFARFDPAATWLSDLRPALGAREFFYEEQLARMRQHGRVTAWNEDSRIRKRVNGSGQVEWQ